MDLLTYRFVYNRKRRLNHQGKALLQLEAYGHGRKAYFSTHLYLTPQQWDTTRQRVRRHPNAVALNRQLRQKVFELEHLELEMRLQGKDVSPEQLKKAIRQPAKRCSFYDFVEERLKQMDCRASTWHNRQSTLHRLRQFRAECEDIPDHTFVDDFEHCLRASGSRTSTVSKHLKHLRLFVNLAIRHGYAPEGSSPFRTYPIPAVRHTPVFLTPDELLRMEAFAEKDCPPSLRPALEAYLFCCYTGLRYSDFVALGSDCFITRDSQTWLELTCMKTGCEVKLPLDLLFEGKALLLLKAHAANPDRFFHPGSNAAVNRCLKTLAACNGIHKPLTFHTARHTFATLLIYKGANITTVQKLLGHKRVTTTEHYGEVLPGAIVKDLMRCGH